MSAAALSFSPFADRLFAGGTGDHASVARIGYRLLGRLAAALRERTGIYWVAEPSNSDLVRADHAAMVAISAGDEAAFARLVDRESPRLLRFVRTIVTSGTAEAEEIVQEALLRLWQQADSWQPNGRVSTWLHQVAYRLSIDTLRRRVASVPIEPDDAVIEDETPAPDAGLLRAEDVRAVRAALEVLPERQRTALVLFHFQELSQAESAAIMGVGERAFESLLARARRGVKAALSGDDQEQGGAS